MMSPEQLSRLDQELRPFLDLPCVGGEQYLGSMFFLDFGAKFSGGTSKGRQTLIGQMTLSLRDVEWWIRHESGFSLSAERTNRELFDPVAKAMEGATISELVFAAEENRLHVHFSGSWLLAVDLSNHWNTDADVVEIALPDGRIHAIQPNGAIIMNSGFDAERARNWASSRLRH